MTTHRPYAGTPPEPSRHHGRGAFVERGLRAKRSLGQCFLADRNIARRIGQLAVIEPGCRTLELGPGTGSLTSVLLDLGADVVAIERDQSLVDLLLATFETASLHVVYDDAAACDWVGLLDPARANVVVGNIPYNLTGKLLRRAIEVADHVRRVVFMVQREVADRVRAPVGTKDYGALSVFMQQRFHVQTCFVVPPTCFRPEPSVHSAVIALEPRPVDPSVDQACFELLVTSAFQHRRKTLRNAWKPRLTDALEQALSDRRLTLQARAEHLTPDDYAYLAKANTAKLPQRKR